MLRLTVPLLLLLVATAVDFRRREIPDWISVALLIWAIGATVFGLAAQGWASLSLGLVLGSALGLLLFWLGGFGGGDAKLLAGLGAVCGPWAFVSLLVYVAVAGGVMAIVAVLRGKRDIAYAPAMALGWLLFMVFATVLGYMSYRNIWAEKKGH